MTRRSYPDRFAEAEFIKGHGCPGCGFTGYRGRSAINEVMIMTDTLRGLVVNHSPANVIKDEAMKEGMVTLRQDGFPVALRFFPLHVHAIVILPLYEYILLEFSYPLRLVSTQVSVWLMRCLGLNVRCDGPSLLFDGQVLSITDACTGIGLLGMLFFLAYWIVRKIRSEAWKKWCWSLLVILWIILANALRLLMTFLLYQVCGQKVFERELHFLLGCFFIVAASLFTWSSAMIFQLDTAKETP